MAKTVTGNIFDYGGLSAHKTEGFMDVFGSEIYGSGTSVDGFVADGGFYGSGLHIMTPMVATNLAVSNSYVNGSNANLPFGYIAGFIVNDNHGALNFNRYWQQKFAFTKNGAGQVDGATLNLQKISGGGPTNAYANFGGGGNFAYIDDNAYALRQTDLTSGGGGAMVSGKLISNLGCSTCDYVHWGVWAAERHLGGDPEIVDISHLMPYIAGTITDTANLPKSYNANYSGSVFGNVLEGSVLHNKTGSMTALINFSGSGNATISGNNLQMNLGGYTLKNASDINFVGQASFNNQALNVTGTATGTGTVNGALFGPAAENFGGNFKFDAGGNQGTGVYLGDDINR